MIGRLAPYRQAFRGNLEHFCQPSYGRRLFMTTGNDGFAFTTTAPVFGAFKSATLITPLKKHQ
ncbi:hypothetical protein BofuT4_P069140.1 [Botrytis cinerea T4]|uniref:Uncharacterized protein n=1 Tax=Botryotinia fuckeliana (strain T4) TaxID=999810 RepID=G2XQG9_BOTF4|nr:hypothetical protein BofuT4_P069140.1 [Botrytis cinerea T4]